MTARRTLPLIRAAALTPFLRFLEGLGEPVQRLLSSSGIEYFPFELPEQPIPLIAALEFATQAASRTGAVDIGCRVVDDVALWDLGVFGKAVLYAPSVRIALQRAASLMRHFSSHETLLVIDEKPSSRIVVHYTRAAEPRRLHIGEQYTAMLIRKVVELSGWFGPCFRRVSFSSDPFDSLDALRPFFGDDITLSNERGMTITLYEGLLDRPLRLRPVGAESLEMKSWLPLGPHLSLREGLSLLLETMLLGSLPTVSEVATVSGMSQRSLQRQLQAEGTSFRELLDATRRALALRYMRERKVSLLGLSLNLGYEHQSSFTRAVKRWTDENPRRLRQLERATV